MVTVELLTGNVVKYTEDARERYYSKGAELSTKDDWIAIRSYTTGAVLFHFDELDEASKQGKSDAESLIEFWLSNGWFTTREEFITRLLSSGFTSDGLEAIATLGTQQEGREIKQPKALEFNGIDEYVDLGTGVGNYTDNFTICGFAYVPASVSSQLNVFSKRSGALGYELRIVTDNTFRFISNGATVSALTSSAMPEGWAFFSFGSDNGNLFLQVNSVKKQTTQSLSSVTGNFYIGAGFNQTNLYNESIAYFQIFNTGLSDEDTENIRTFQSISTNPVNEYNFEEEAGSIAIDSGTGKQNGTIVNYVDAMRVDAPFQTFVSQANEKGYSKYTYFDGVDDFIEFNSFSLENKTFKIKFIYTSGEQQVLSFQDFANTNRTLGITINSQTSNPAIVAVSTYEFSSLDFTDNFISQNNFSLGQLLDIEITTNSLGKLSSVFLNGTALTSSNTNNLASRLDAVTPNAVRLGIRGNGSFEYRGLVLEFEVDGILLAKNSNNWVDEIGSNDGVISGTPEKVIIPTKNVTQDILDNPLQFTGKVPYNFDVVNANYLQGNGTNRSVTVGNTGLSVTSVEVYVLLNVDNQVLFALQNSTATAVSVVAGVLTFGGSLSASNIEVDDVSVTASEAGALLNDNTWHKVSFDLVSIAASNLVLFTDGTSFGDIGLSQAKLNGIDLLPLSDGASNDVTEIATGSTIAVINPDVTMWQQDATGKLPSFNLLNGYSLYEHATSNPLRIPYDNLGNPIPITPPTGYTKTGDFPAGVGHNGAEVSVKAPQVKELFDADINNFLFDATPESQEIDYADFVAENGDVNSQGKITYDLNTTNRTVQKLTIKE